MENNQKVLKPVLSSLLLLMEHNQNQQKLEFLWNTKIDRVLVFQLLTIHLQWWSPWLFMMDTTFFVEETDQKTWILTVNIGLKHPKKRVISPNQVGDLRLTNEVVAIYVAIIFLTQSSSFPKKTQDLFHLPFFTIAFLGFPMIFLRSTNGFPMGFQPASRALSKTRPASRSVPRYNWACPWPRGRSCTAMRRFSGFALRWMVVFYGFLCQKRLVVEEHWDKPRNVLKCWKWDTIVPNCWDYNMLIEFTLLLWDMKWE